MMIILKSHSLENEHSFEILVSLLKYGEQNKQTLYASIGRATKTYQARINELIEMGLIVVDIQKFNHNVHFVSLTEKGRKIAEKISEIEDIMSKPS